MNGTIPFLNFPSDLVRMRQVMRRVILSNGKISASLNGRSRQLFSTKVDSFNNGTNAVYVEQMYDAWKTDPKRFVIM